VGFVNISTQNYNLYRTIYTTRPISHSYLSITATLRSLIVSQLIVISICRDKKWWITFLFAAGPGDPIPSHCCGFPFTLNGVVHNACFDDGGGLGCFYGDRVWKLCVLPAGK